MHKISKEYFKNIMAENEHYFVGVTHTAPTNDKAIEIYNHIHELIQRAGIKTRTAKRQSMGLKFSDGSHLYLAGEHISCWSMCSDRLLVVDIGYEFTAFESFEPVMAHKYLVYVII